MSDEIQIVISGSDRGGEDALHRVNRAMGDLDGRAGGLMGTLSRMGEVAGGVLVAGGIAKLGGALMGAAKDAFQATADYERLGLAMENLAKRDLVAAGEIVKVTQVGTKQIEMTAKNTEAVQKLNLQRDIALARMQEEQERHRQLIAKWGESGLAVKTHAAEMAKSQYQIEQMNAKIAELGSSVSKTIPIFKTSKESLVSETEAKELAAKTSKELLNWIEQLAIKSPFTQEGVAKAFRTANAYGFVADQALDLAVKTGKLTSEQRAGEISAQRLTQAMIDFAAGSGADAFAMDRIALALGQIKARGKLAGQEVRQLTEAGLSVYPVLSKAFGKSTEEIIKMQEQGLIPADKAIKAIVESMEKDFGGAALRQATSFAGLVSTLSDVKTIGLREFFTGTFEALQPYLNDFATWIQNIIPRLSEIGAGIGQSVASSITSLMGFFQVLGSFGRYIAAILEDGDTLNDWLTHLPESLQPLALVVGTVTSFISTVLGGLLTFLSTVQSSLTSSSSNILSNLIAVGSLFLSFFGPILTTASTTWTTVWNTIQTTVTTALTNVSLIVSGVLASIGSGIALHTGEISAAFTQAYNAISGIVYSVVSGISATVNLFLGEILLYVQTHGAQLREFFGNAYATVTLTVASALESIRGIVANVLSIVIGSVTSNLDRLREIFYTIFTRVQEIVSTVLSAVSSIVTNILSNIRTFIQTHGEDIRTFLSNAWEQIGRIIDLALQVIQATIVPAIQAIAMWIREHGDEIQKAMEVTWNAIKGIIKFVLDLIEGILKVALKVLKGDWKGAWEEIKATGERLLQDIKLVINANLEAIKLLFGKAIQNLIEKVTKWLNDTNSKVTKGLSDLSQTVENKLEDVKNWFKTKFEEILAWIGTVPSRMVTLGEQIIQGLIDGVGNMADAFWEAITNIIDWAIQKVRDALGLQSPSKVFFQFAVDTIQGWINGILEATPEAIQVMVTSINSILDVVTKALDLFTNIQALGSLEGLGVRITQVISLLRSLVVQVARVAGQLITSAVEKAASFSEATIKIVSLLSEALSLFEALNLMEVTTSIRAKVDALVSFVRYLVVKMAQVAHALQAGAVANAAAFAGLVSQIVSPLQGIVEAFTSAASWVPQNLGPVLENLTSNLLVLARLWVRLGMSFSAEMLVGALYFASIVKTLTDPLVEMVGAFTSVFSWVPQQLDAAFGTLLHQLRRLAYRWIDAAVGFDSDLLEGALYFASVTETLTAPLVSMVTGFNVVASWVPQNLSQAFGWIILQLKKLAREWIAAAALFDEELLTGALWFADLATRIVAPLSAMVQAFTVVANYAAARIGPQVTILIDQLVGVSRKLSRAAALFSPEVIAATALFAEASGKIVAPLQSMVTNFTAVSSYVPTRIGPIVDAMVDQLLGLARKMARAGLLFSDDIIAGAARFAAAATAIVAPLKNAVDGLSAVASYVVTRLGPKMNALIESLVELAKLMSEASLAFDEKLLTAAGHFASIATQLVAPLKSMVDGFTAVAGYSQGFTDIVIPFSALVDHLLQLVPLLISASGQFKDEAALAAAAKFAGFVSSMVSPLKAAVEAFTAVAGYSRTDIILPFARLVDDLASLARELIRVSPQFDSDLLAAAANVAQKIASMVGMVRPGIDAIKALADYVQVVGITEAAAAFASDIASVAWEIKEGLEAGELRLTEALEAMTELAQKIATLVGFVKPGLEAIAALSSYTRVSNIAVAAAAFASDIAEVAFQLKEGLEAGELGLSPALEAAVALAQKIASLVGFVRPGLEAIAALTSYVTTGNIAAATAAFAADILIVATELRDGLGNASPEFLAALEVAGTLATRINGIFGFIAPAIEAMRDLREYSRPYGVGTGIVTLMRDLTTLIEWMETTFNELGPDTVQAAALFAELINTIIGSIAETLLGLSQLGGLSTSYQSGLLLGQNWIEGLIAGLNLRLPNLEALMAYIRGLFPSSPAKYGPFRNLPTGDAIGDYWGASLVKSMEDNLGPLNLLMGEMYRSFSMPNLNRPSSVSQVQNINLTMAGSWSVRSDQDIMSIASQVGEVLSGQADINRRMNVSWSSAL